MSVLFFVALFLFVVGVLNTCTTKNKVKAFIGIDLALTSLVLMGVFFSKAKGSIEYNTLMAIFILLKTLLIIVSYWTVFDKERP